MTAKAVVAVVVLAVAGRSRQSGLARPAACITGENFGTPPWVLLPTAPPKQPSSGRMLEMWVCALPCARATWVKSLL